MRDVDYRVEQWLDTAEKTFIFACHAHEWFARGTLEDKRQILMAVGSNLLLKDKNLCIEAKKPFFVLENSLKAFPREILGFKPLKNGSTKPQDSHLLVPNSLWRPYGESNPDLCRERALS